MKNKSTVSLVSLLSVILFSCNSNPGPIYLPASQSPQTTVLVTSDTLTASPSAINTNQSPGIEYTASPVLNLDNKNAIYGGEDVVDEKIEPPKFNPDNLKKSLESINNQIPSSIPTATAIPTPLLQITPGPVTSFTPIATPTPIITFTSIPTGTPVIIATPTSVPISVATPTPTVTSIPTPIPTATVTPVIISTPTTVISPVVIVNPSSGKNGTLFTFNGTGFTPNGTATINYSSSNNSNISSSPQDIDTNGKYSRSFNANDQPGTYYYWAKDNTTGKETIHISYDLSADTNIVQQRLVDPRIEISPNIGNSSSNFVCRVYGCTTNGWISISIKFPGEKNEVTQSIYQQTDINGYTSFTLPKSVMQTQGEYFVLLHDNTSGKNSSYVTYEINP